MGDFKQWLKDNHEFFFENKSVIKLDTNMPVHSVVQQYLAALNRLLESSNLTPERLKAAIKKTVKDLSFKYGSHIGDAFKERAELMIKSIMNYNNIQRKN